MSTKHLIYTKYEQNRSWCLVTLWAASPGRSGPECERALSAPTPYNVFLAMAINSLHADCGYLTLFAGVQSILVAHKRRMNTYTW